MKYTILYILLIISAVTLTACPGLDGLLGDKSSDDSSSSSDNNNNQNSNQYYIEQIGMTFIILLDTQNLYIKTTAADNRQGTYKAKFSVTNKPDIMVDGVYGQSSKISALSSLVHGASYTLKTISDGAGELNVISGGVEIIPNKELIKFTSYNGNAAGAGTYTLKVLGVTYTYDSTAGGFPNVLTYLKINGKVLSSTSKGEIVLDITSSKDTAWNYCDTATARTCQIAYSPIPYLADRSAGNNFEYSVSSVVALNKVRENHVAFVNGGITSDEALPTGFPAACLAYTGNQESRDVTLGQGPISDRYNTINKYYRYKQGTVDKRPYGTADENTNVPELGTGGTTWPVYLKIDYATLTANTVVAKELYVADTYEISKENDANIVYCNTTKLKYYVLSVTRQGNETSGAGIVTQSFTP